MNTTRRTRRSTQDQTTRMPAGYHLFGLTVAAPLPVHMPVAADLAASKAETQRIGVVK
jgi:hypothetical protein